MYADVLVEIKARNIDQSFTYIVGNDIKDKIKIGCRVLVPFGNQKIEGFVLKLMNIVDTDLKLKKIIELVDFEPVLNEELLKLGEYISKKTLCSLISAYQTMLPAALKAHKNFVVPKKYVTCLKLINYKYEPKNENQKIIIDKLSEKDIEKNKLTSISISSVNTLIKNGIIEEYKKEVYRLENIEYEKIKKPILTYEQKIAVNKIKEKLNTFSPFLLYGVTGSGKTEVYLNIIEDVLSSGKEVIMLVPEISLTPQMVSIFKSRFKDSVAILHSALSDGEKYDEWRKIERKEVSIVVGARSAIFAPLTNIGLIILDEEHSDTYKQDNNPHYNAIDIAIKRSKTYNCPVVFGSATPLIESYTRAKKGVYTLLELKERINKSMPKIKLIDMKDEIKKGNNILSNELKIEIQKRLEINEQVILLLNRRGYSTTIICRECGNVVKCPNCDIPLTYHKNGNKLNCHYCNYTTYKPKICEVCGSEVINDYGIGTEKLEELINNEFKNARVIRMDLDTTTKKGSHEKIVTAFKNKEYNVLIGTQMISKGLDFEDVTLVGVINGDATLNIPDYRSGERTFSLLSQVSGRSGRSKKIGSVIIQCFNKEHYSINYVVNNDYNSFYNEEMSIRKKLNYPPYCNLCLIKLSSKDFSLLSIEANRIKNYLKDNSKNIEILGPSLSGIPKVFNKYYIQIIIKYKNIKDIYDNLVNILKFNKNKDKVLIDIDFNPKKI